MIYLYHGGGAGITEVTGDALPQEAWVTLRSTAVRLLRARSQVKSAEALTRYPFELLSATNFFGDEFAILRLKATMEQYVALTELQHDQTAANPFHLIAATITELDTYVRFVVMLLDTEDGTLPVAPPSPQVTTEAVERALADAELLLRSRGPEHALDRVHTALHAYLRAILDRNDLTYSQTATATELFKVLREGHAPLRDLGTRANEMRRIIMALATTIDALGTLRNTASGAHPNPLLESPEAMLAINAARSLIHYLDERAG